MSELEQRMDRVSGAVHQYITSQKSQLFQSHEEHRNTLSRIQSSKQQLHSTIHQLQQKEKELNEALDMELQEVQKSETRVEELTQRQVQLSAERQSLLDQVNELLQSVSGHRDELNRLQKGISSNQEKDLPEVLLFERLLGLKIVGLKEDVLKFVFKNIWNDNWEKEGYVVLDVSKEEYVLVDSHPQLENIGELIGKLNESRDLTRFLGDLRKGFKSIV